MTTRLGFGMCGPRPGGDDEPRAAQRSGPGRADDRGAHPRTARPPRPPLPELPSPSTGSDQVEPYLDIGQLDPSGRTSARPLLHRLGWPPGHRITFDVAHGTITVRFSPAGRHTIGATGLLAVPAAVRQLCNLVVGDLVVLLADPGRDLLLIYPARTVAQLLADQFAIGDGS
ncbi:hypothetical protein OHA72_27260 [Dactylosporangium sp. NBC_01737]|uniref:hypothetical protein n=1 Tax=Dactylosporangium sp. NBC_01737 TaxID=2975959 RepID=UPI002E122DFF|nr:hypothetical protein OHA72_27260 [Dactylosporangium sp. NBC_01737]